MRALPSELSASAEATLRAIADGLRFPPQRTIVAAVVAVERFVDDLVVQATEDVLRPAGLDLLVTSDILRKRISDATSTWPERHRQLKLFAFAEHNSEPVQKFNQLLELRNAIAHGGGGLSPFQLADKLPKQLALLKQWSDLHVTFASGQLVFANESSKVASRTARDFVLHVDAKQIAGRAS